MVDIVDSEFLKIIDFDVNRPYNCAINGEVDLRQCNFVDYCCMYDGESHALICKKFRVRATVSSDPIFQHAYSSEIHFSYISSVWWRRCDRVSYSWAVIQRSVPVLRLHSGTLPSDRLWRYCDQSFHWVYATPQEPKRASVFVHTES